jgi:hypothetical protein
LQSSKHTKEAAYGRERITYLTKAVENLNVYAVAWITSTVSELDSRQSTLSNQVFHAITGEAPQHITKESELASDTSSSGYHARAYSSAEGAWDLGGLHFLPGCEQPYRVKSEWSVCWAD